jgi:hypothetical protein
LGIKKSTIEKHKLSGNLDVKAPICDIDKKKINILSSIKKSKEILKDQLTNQKSI